MIYIINYLSNTKSHYYRCTNRQKKRLIAVVFRPRLQGIDHNLVVIMIV